MLLLQWLHANELCEDMKAPSLYSILVILRRKASKDLNPLSLLPLLSRLRVLAALGMTKQRPGVMVGAHLVDLWDSSGPTLFS